MLLPHDHDPMGAAIEDYFEGKRPKTLRIHSSMFDEDEMPIPHLFRTEMEMSRIEQIALSLCHGKVLDVGAGAGAHSIILQGREGVNVTAIDISPRSVEVMRRRGIHLVEAADFFADKFNKTFDTILLMMNGIGVVGRVNSLPDFFRRLDELLVEGGCAILDSSDIKYIYEDDELTPFIPDSDEPYYGEVDYTMHYGSIHGLPFDWHYIDEGLLKREATKHGFHTEIIFRGEHYDYLARLTRVLPKN